MSVIICEVCEKEKDRLAIEVDYPSCTECITCANCLSHPCKCGSK